MTVVPALGRLRQEDTKSEVRLSYIAVLRPDGTRVRFCLRRKI